MSEVGFLVFMVFILVIATSLVIGWTCEVVVKICDRLKVVLAKLESRL